MPSPNYHTNILLKYIVIFGTLVIFFIFILFSQHYINSRRLDSNIFTIKCQESFKKPKEKATSLSHLMFVLVGSSRAWKNRRAYAESWWRPNVTRGNLFFDKEPSKEFLPWSPNFPQYRISEDPLKLKSYSKRRTVHTRIYRSILENFRLMQNKGVRWYVMGDDDSVFFLENLLKVLSKYDYKEKHYIGMYSETIKSNVQLSFEMGYGGGGFALSYPLVEALVAKLDECSDRYHYIWAADHLTSICLSDLGADFFPEKGFHQMDLHGDLSGLLSSHPTAPLLTLHHFERVKPLFPNLDRPKSVKHIMKAANVDQSRIVQQSICHVRAKNWTFSVSWGYSAHIYENIFSRSQLMLPIETFSPWLRGRPPFFMFNTRNLSKNPCEAPHWFFFDSISEREEKGFVVTYYTRKFARNMTSCSISGNISADPITLIRVVSPKTPKQERKVECCDVEYKGADVANIRLRDCRRGEFIG